MHKKFGVVTGLVLGLLLMGGVALAQSSQSPNYIIDESFIGPGGELESSSPSFRTAPGGQSIGNPGGVGDSEASTNYRTQSGATTTNDPSLSCQMNTSSVNFGLLSPSVPATATASFSVLNYTSHGYIVQVIGDTPNNGGHNLTAMSSNGASSPGTEQFGINLIDNSSPDIGDDPVQVPSDEFSYGEAASNYDTPNSFRYNNGETIAQSVKTTGETDYTISYLVNVANSTPGGAYSGSQTVVCVGTY